MQMLAKEVGDLIKNAIKSSGKNQQEIAIQIGITPAALSEMLAGKKRLPLKRFHQISKILDFDSETNKKINELYKTEQMVLFTNWRQNQVEEYKRLFFDVDIFDNVNAINIALRNRDSLDKSSPNYEEDFNDENKTITDELINMFQKIAMALKVDALPVDYNKLLVDTMIQYERKILDAVMASSVNPEAKITIYNTIKDIE